MDVEENIALDLLKGNQFDDIWEDLSVGEAVVDVSLCTSVVWSWLDTDDTRSGSTFLVDQEQDAKLSQCFPWRNVSLKAFWDVKERLSRQPFVDLLSLECASALKVRDYS